MKNTLAISLLVCATTFCLCGCASDKRQETAKASPASPSNPSQSSPPAQSAPAQPPEVKYPGQEHLKVGMTTDEVVHIIGSPLGTGSESDGSQFWTYNHWEAPPDSAFSPVNPTVLVLTVIFDTNGKVLNWYAVARHSYGR